MRQSSNYLARTLLRILGLTLSVLPPVLAVLSYFPIWIDRGDKSAVSGFALLLIAAALLPCYRVIRRVLHSPSAYMMWIIAFLVFALLSRIADEMTVISFVGAVSNSLGAVLFAIARKYTDGREDGHGG